jgi:hypothetical protein
MNPFLRYALLPFLLLFNISALLAVFAGLDVIGVWSLPVGRATTFLGQFGVAGTAAWFLLSLNVVIAGLLLLIGIPLYLLRRDIRQTIDRFGIFETRLTVDPDAPYVEAAREVFDERPETAVFCYGHTHRPRMKELDGRLLVNTGTWLKRLHRRDGIIGILPPVFYPSYQLCAVRIAPEPDTGAVAVEYEAVEKPSPMVEELTLTERLFTVGREPNVDLPDRAVTDGAAPGSSDATD